MMVKFGRTNHLSHPLCETLLRQKWLSYGFPIYMLNLGFYLLFIIAFSYFIVNYPSCNHHDSSPSQLTPTSTSSCPDPRFRSFDQTAHITHAFCIRYLVVYCFVNFILEIIQFVQDGWDYLGDIENYIQWGLYISTCVFTLPFLFNQSWHYQWVAGSIGIFMAYFALLFLLGKFDIYGIYVIMFLEILKTLLQVLSLFSILIVGFALTFCVIQPFSNDLRPSNPRHLFLIILKSVMMMLGELDFDDTYLERGKEQHFPNINLVVLLLFAIIMPILLMNLLVGLAIGDLMQIQQNARLKRLAMQVQYHSNLEKKIPYKLLHRWSKDEFIIYFNRTARNHLLFLSKHWIARPLYTQDHMDVDDKFSTENVLFTEMMKQKRRQKEMQRQMEKITDLTRLIVQKMEISADIEMDDTSDHNTSDACQKMKRFQLLFRTVRRLASTDSSN